MAVERRSLGFQIGLSETDIVLLAINEGGMKAEMLSYSRSRGLFAGISLEGATLRPDGDSNRELYGRDATNREILTGDFKTPAVEGKFERALHRTPPNAADSAASEGPPRLRFAGGG